MLAIPTRFNINKDESAYSYSGLTENGKRIAVDKNKTNLYVSAESWDAAEEKAEQFLQNKV